MADQLFPAYDASAFALGIPGEPAPLPEALQTPTRRVRIRFIFSLTLATAAIFFSISPIPSILMPLQIQEIDGANKIAVLGLISGLSALVAVITNPIVGALSDRTTSRFGRRRPWLLAGGLLAPISMFVMMNAHSIPVLLVGALGLQFFANFVFSTLTAIIPDQIPAEQRGLVGALVGLVVPIVGLAGSVVIGALMKDMTIRYLTVIILVPLVLVPYAFLVPDKRLTPGYLPPFRLMTFLKGFWISPRKHPDFGLVWLARFGTFLGYNIAIGYLLYYLQDDLNYSKLFPGQSVTQGVAVLSIFTTAALFISTPLGGILSDRLKRRKPFVIASSAISALGLFMLAFIPTWNGAIIALVLVGLGVGAYLSVDQALATEVLPNATDRAKDMGIIGIANTLPGSLGPVIAAPILTATHSYLVLFVLGGFVSLVGSFIIQPVKSVR